MNPPSTPTFSLRPATVGDLPAITAIYGHHVRHGTGSFEIEPPSIEQMGERFTRIEASGWPWLVAEIDGQVVGFAYAGPYKERPAYRFTVEDSVYVAPEAIGQGVGRRLLQALIDRCTALGARQMMAVIGDSANTASIGLHRRLGFVDIGTARALGYKFDRWLDVVYLQRTLA